MTDLSHAQKAVLKAGGVDQGWPIHRKAIAAALEAVADEVVPYEKAPNLMRSHELERLVQRQHTRTQLLAIAAELRGDTTKEAP